MICGATCGKWKWRFHTQGCCWSQKGSNSSDHNKWYQLVDFFKCWRLLLQATAKAAGYGHLGEGPKMAGVSFKLMNPPRELFKLASPVATHFQSCWTFEVHSPAWKRKRSKKTKHRQDLLRVEECSRTNIDIQPPNTTMKWPSLKLVELLQL